MDSHADSCVAGGNCVVLEYTGRSAEVEAYYTPDSPSKQILIARGNVIQLSNYGDYVCTIH
jgi:hypothetical protein